MPVNLIIICHHCEFRTRTPGRAYCIAEAEPVTFEDRAAAKVCPKGFYENPPKITYPPIAVPREQWPAKITKIATHAIPSDKGIGDTLERRYARFGGRIYKRLRKMINWPCSCDVDQANLNAVYPYQAT